MVDVEVEDGEPVDDNIHAGQSFRFEDLLELNYKELHEQLSTVECIKKTYKANDLIEILSEKKESDKRLINDYHMPSELINRKVIGSNGCIRTCRFLTIKGIERYLSEGKVYAYENACKFFGIKPISLQEKKWIKELEKMSVGEAADDDESKTQYNTNMLLKWLFGKRKMCRELGPSTTVERVFEVLDEKSMIKERVEFIKKREGLE